MISLFAQTQLAWEELARQVPLLAVALLVAWYAFRHISTQQEHHLTDIRNHAEQTLKMLNDAHSRIESAKDAQIKELQATLQAERAEKERLLKVIDNIGASP